MAAVPIPQDNPTASAQPVRVMVVDDSVVVRSLLQRWLTADDRLELVGMANDGGAALDLLKKHDVDVVVLDIAMPVMDGMTALPRIRILQPHAQIIISSTLTTQNAEISLAALHAGAADYVTKPAGKAVVLGGQDFFTHLLEKILALGQVSQNKKSGTVKSTAAAPRKEARVVQSATRTEKRASFPADSSLTLKPEKAGFTPEILAIGASTGGPQALFHLLAELPKPFALPIVIVQHMPPIFTDILAQQLTRSTGIDTCEAQDEQLLEAGKAYVAPGDVHMRIIRDGTRARIALSQDAPVNYCRPAVDPFFQSLATSYGSHVLAVVLTGMGRDGLAGARILSDQGSTVLVQDEATSVVWGMPGMIAKAGLANDILPLTKIANAISVRTSGKRP
jgi:two-component system, chemotaxis family, protein-glutamate methylesterase/glutaminase